eukprot:TRINITY_DN17133_c0_g1_i1.p1 TRINITY_DN17133_c0_g1~~TRINITY_DN17133_c0_g1_i1.p1  ORF type:complete len:324 (+),score=87.30 TRINITY_DN17133_c0_g1_i1:43-1014(+)
MRQACILLAIIALCRAYEPAGVAVTDPLAVNGQEGDDQCQLARCLNVDAQEISLEDACRWCGREECRGCEWCQKDVPLCADWTEDVLGEGEEQKPHEEPYDDDEGACPDFCNIRPLPTDTLKSFLVAACDNCLLTACAPCSWCQTMCQLPYGMPSWQNYGGHGHVDEWHDDWEAEAVWQQQHDETFGLDPSHSCLHPPAGSPLWEGGFGATEDGFDDDEDTDYYDDPYYLLPPLVDPDSPDDFKPNTPEEPEQPEVQPAPEEEQKQPEGQGERGAGINKMLRSPWLWGTALAVGALALSVVALAGVVVAVRRYHQRHEYMVIV